MASGWPGKGHGALLKRRYLAGRQIKNEFNTAKPRPTHCKKKVFESLIRAPKEH
jgi:hypothetical protein